MSSSDSTEKSIRPSPKDWFHILGSRDLDLENEINQRLSTHIEKQDFSLDNVCYVEKVDFSLVKGSLDVSEKQLEKLRRLCQLWDIKLNPVQISSHRPVIGKAIVLVKKVFFRLLGVLLKDVFHQQKSFNAATIDLIADLLPTQSKKTLKIK